MKKLRFFVLLPILVFLVAWGISFAKCEILSLTYGNEFKKNIQKEILIENIDYLKVIEYSKNKASVYYVSNNCSRGDVITFTKKNGDWKYEKWNTIWSIQGSAEGVIWPYWWHFFYSHSWRD